VRFEAARRERLGDPLLKTYRAIDAEIGRLAEAAGGNADLFVYLSNGMGAHYDGTFLLDEVLERIEGHDSGEGVGAIRGAVKPWIPRIRDIAIRARIPIPIRLPLARWLRGDLAASRAQRRYFVEPNNTVFSGIRLNLVGREPLGKIRPDEVDAVCAALTEDLMALVNVDSGGSAVRGVHRCDDHHRREPDDCLPDLFVEWERSVPIEAVASPKIGTVRIPYSRIRTGDHRPDGLLLAVGPGFEAGAEMPSIAVEDIGPSLAARFGVTLDDVDGETVPWLAGSSRLSGPVPLTAEARR
jgi:predicted AlkP superfamily phosphohydrolase/phosphomutase